MVSKLLPLLGRAKEGGQAAAILTEMRAHRDALQEKAKADDQSDIDKVHEQAENNQLVGLFEVRLHITGNARIKILGKSVPCIKDNL